MKVLSWFCCLGDGESSVGVLTSCSLVSSIGEDERVMTIVGFCQDSNPSSNGSADRSVIVVNELDGVEGNGDKEIAERGDKGSSAIDSALLTGVLGTVLPRDLLLMPRETKAGFVLGGWSRGDFRERLAVLD